MARSSDPNSANSQFFICFGPAPHLDRQYTVFGKVIEGMEYVDSIKDAVKSAHYLAHTEYNSNSKNPPVILFSPAEYVSSKYNLLILDKTFINSLNNILVLEYL